MTATVRLWRILLCQMTVIWNAQLHCWIARALEYLCQIFHSSNIIVSLPNTTIDLLIYRLHSTENLQNFLQIIRRSYWHQQLWMNSWKSSITVLLQSFLFFLNIDASLNADFMPSFFMENLRNWNSLASLSLHIRSCMKTQISSIFDYLTWEFNRIVKWPWRITVLVFSTHLEI